MGILSRIFGRRAPRAPHFLQSRQCRIETFEPRSLLTAAPSHVGVIYAEDDSGSDLTSDRFEISFVGGAEGSKLKRLVIDGDQDGNGFDESDVFFDTITNLQSYGALQGQPAVFRADLSDNVGQVTFTVVDGSTKLIIDFTDFDAGEKAVFTIDVDEAENFTPGETDWDTINGGFDTITSGVEFQSSKLTATIAAPHYYDITETDTFLNAYDAKFAGKNLDLPADNFNGFVNRTAGGVVSLQQLPLPISISGTVFEDPNLNNHQDSGDPGLVGVKLELWQLNTQTGTYSSTGHTTTTDAQGHYRFDGAWLLPGTYRVVETQPAAPYFSVGATAGKVDGATRGTVQSTDVITDIALLGGDNSAGNDFAEALPGSLAGYVFIDANDNGVFDSGEQGIGGVTIQLLDSAGNPTGRTATTSAAVANLGYYIFSDLRPGTYGVAEVQPSAFDDGKDQVGSAGGTALAQPGDRITGATIVSKMNAVNYNFGELVPPGSLSGYVFVDPNMDCIRDSGEQPIAGVQVHLLNQAGAVIRTVTTDANGKYFFDKVPPGIYSVVEDQPNGYFQGGQTVGSGTGTIVGDDNIGGIQITSRVDLVEYNFCEIPPASLSGNVFVDADDDGFRDPGEQGIAGVTLRLLDEAGNPTGATTVTDSVGHYTFTNLHPGKYGVAEVQPTAYDDGKDQVGSAGGVAAPQPGDRITLAMLTPGLNAVDYNFGELVPPGSLSGYVFVDPDGDCMRLPSDVGIAGVKVHLVDQNGNVLRTTTTDASGRYEFKLIPPGVYGVIEDQPNGFYHGGQMVGSGTGTVVGEDHLGGIQVSSRIDLVEYNFCELPPGSLSGYVFIDPDMDCMRENGDTGIAGVKVNLLNQAGQVIRTATTDVNGHYQFDNMQPGIYSVVEEQPNGFFHGGEMVGSGTGIIVGPDHIGGIQVNSAVDLVNYNFCEILPASLSGHVYVDLDNDGNRDVGEQPIAGVTLQLLDANGTFAGRTTTTDANGFYKFDNLMPGTWGVAEVQPAGWRDGKDTPGSAGGVSLPTPGDKITGAHLDPDEDAVEYNFGERPLPGSLRGIVFVDPDQDCIYDAGESPIPNVIVELLDASGAVIRVTTTNAQGQYQFTDIEPGQYSVRERQPNGFFQGGTTVGSGDGVAGEDIVTAINIGPNAHLIDYNFCEIPPGTISGFVFQDGPVIEVTDPEAPLNFNDYRDGKLTPDDTRLGGVTLELRNGVNGEPILGSAALPGTYNPTQPIRVVTRADGYYEFVGLTPGNYGVFEVQPESYIDFRDTAGEINAHQVGVAVNQFDAFAEDILELLTVPHQFDAILRIQLPAGTDSKLNNFSEVKIQSIPIDILPPPAPLPPPPPPVVVSPPPEEPRLIFEPLIDKLASLRLQGSGANGYTWHLSVVNAGFPRGPQERTDVIVQNIAMRMEQQAFAGRKLNESSWTLPGATPGTTRKVNFGLKHSKAVVGDFNGDGISDIAVFQDGQWFIDLNGNGVWDESDLWAKLGHKDDRPVAGDWDGDGKDDIGIFGPAWPGDPRAIEAEPGLPDPMNLPQGKAKNLPPLPQEAAIGARALKLTSAGKLRADLIDHVFHYGTATDVPIVGDWNGDGITTIGVFRDGAWRLDVDGDGRWSKGDLALEFGQAGDKPVIGDWNGDGIDDLGVYRNGAFILDSNGDHLLDDRDTRIDMHGTADDQPIAGDFDGDGHDEPALYHDGGGVQTAAASADGAAASATP